MVGRWSRKNTLDVSTSEPSRKSWSLSLRNSSSDSSNGPPLAVGVNQSLSENTPSSNGSLIGTSSTTSIFSSLSSSFTSRSTPSTIETNNTPNEVSGSTVRFLHPLIGNEELSDVRMQGCDGGTVFAVKAILAARSPVFHSRFFGAKIRPENSSDTILCSNSSNLTKKDDQHLRRTILRSNVTPNEYYEEANDTDADRPAIEKDAEMGNRLHQAFGVKKLASTSTEETEVITLEDTVDRNGKTKIIFKEWDCCILNLIVEYCYTSNLAIFSFPPSDMIARTMASLRCASMAFQLRGLREQVENWSNINTTCHPDIACAMIDEGIRLDSICLLAMRTVKLKAKSALMPVVGAAGSGICALSKPGLILILRYLEDKVSHTLLYDALLTWVHFSTERTGHYSDPVTEKAGKFRFASRCAMRFIRVSEIDSSRMESGLKSGFINIKVKKVI